METVIAYFDETGDDGLLNSSSEDFILTSVYTKTNNWQNNYNAMKNCRAILKEKYGFHSIEKVLVTLRHYKRLNLKASPNDEYGLVIYPK